MPSVISIEGCCPPSVISIEGCCPPSVISIISASPLPFGICAVFDPCSICPDLYEDDPGERIDDARIVWPWVKGAINGASWTGGDDLIRISFEDSSNCGFIPFSGDVTSGVDVISNTPLTANLLVGYEVSGTGIPSGSTITAIIPNTSVTISNNATATNTGVSLTAVAAGFTPPGNATIQQGIATRHVCLCAETKLTINMNGVTEQNDANFEVGVAKVNGTTICSGASVDNNLLCEMINASASGFVILPAGEHDIELTASTVDALFHVGCYWEFSFIWEVL